MQPQPHYPLIPFYQHSLCRRHNTAVVHYVTRNVVVDNKNAQTIEL